MQFRDDILRGVRLFAITFAGILVCVAAYRMLRSPFEAQGATGDALVAPQPPPAGQETPLAEASPEPHGLVVPPPPPSGAAAPPVRRATAQRNLPVPPPPPLTRPTRAPVQATRAFESAEVGGALPAIRHEEALEPSPDPGKKGVGYKSLLEANANRIQEQPLMQAPTQVASEPPAKGNRFFRAVGKIFHGGKRETPSGLQPNQP